MKLLTILGIAATLAIGLIALTGNPAEALLAPAGAVAEAHFIEIMPALTLTEQVLMFVAAVVLLAIIVWLARPIEPGFRRRGSAGNDNRLQIADPRPPG